MEPKAHKVNQEWLVPMERKAPQVRQARKVNQDWLVPMVHKAPQDRKVRKVRKVPRE